MNAAGATLEPAPFEIDRAGNHPDIAFDGTSHLVVWWEERTGRSREIYGRRVAPDGTFLDTTSFPIGSATGFQHYPSVAFGGGMYLVTWVDARAGVGSVYGARVTPSGEVLDLAGIPIHVPPRGAVSTGSVRAAWDGTAFVVTWADVSSPRADVYLARVGMDGEVLDRPAVYLAGAEQPSVPIAPPTAVASARRGETLVGYALHSTALAVDTLRVRTYSTGALGLGCATAAECESGFCVDGVCCDARCEGLCEACSTPAGAPADGS